MDAAVSDIPQGTEGPSPRGICHIVGAGPGDEGLITLRGLECLREAEVVCYDYLCNPALLRHAPAGAEKIFVGKNSGRGARQEDINRLLVEKVREGKVVCRLKGGDPFVFGRGGEEALALREAGLDFDIVPGISSSVAVPAYAGIPVTHRGLTSSFTVITGHEDPTKPDRGIDWRKVAEYPGTKVILMGVGKIREIAGLLIGHGLPAATPVAVISWGTWGRQRTVTGTLQDIGDRTAAAGVEAPAVTVLGDVVGLRGALNWFESRPLFGRRMVVTRTRDQGSEACRKLRALGAEVLELPTLRIERVEVAGLAAQCASAGWIFLNSPNAVDHALGQVVEETGDIRALGSARIAVVGPATARRLAAYHLRPAFQASKFTARDMAAQFLLEHGAALSGQTVLWPHGNLADRGWTRGLEEAGAIVRAVEVYRTLPETADPTGARHELETRGAHWILFASSSAAENFAAMGIRTPFGADVPRRASIGPETSRRLRELGLAPDREAAQHTIDGLIRAVLEAETSDVRSP